jgi:hypothetical protein
MMRRVLALLVFACLLCSPALAATWNYTNSGTATFNAGDIYPSSGSYSGFQYVNNGTVNVLGNSTIGSTTASLGYYGYNIGQGPYVFSNGSGTFSGAVLNVGDATHNATLTVADVQPQVAIYQGNTVNIAAGSALALVANVVGSGNQDHETQLYIDRGTVNLAGKIQFAPDHPLANYYTMMFSSYGTLQVQGNQAVIERLPNPAGTGYAKEMAYPLYIGRQTSFDNSLLYQGSLTGNGRLTWVNSSGNATFDKGELINYGVIAPGTAAATGTLELANLSIFCGNGGSMQFRLSGTTAGAFDVLTLSGTNAQLSPGNVNILTMNGFTPHAGDHWQIMNYTSLANYEYGYYDNPIDLGGNFSLQYNADNAVLTYVPEPATLSLLAMAGLAMLRRRKLRWA